MSVKASALEDYFAWALRTLAPWLKEPEREYRFSPPRRWRFDFAWPDEKVAVEVEGGTWSFGRHVRGRGYAADCEKYNAAVIDGWRVLRFTGGMLRDDVERCVRQVERLVAGN